jgi:hypothetical protein
MLRIEIVHTRGRPSNLSPPASLACTLHTYDMRAEGSAIDSARYCPPLACRASPSALPQGVPAVFSACSGARVAAVPTAAEGAAPTAHGTLKPVPRRGRLAGCMWSE